MGRLNGAVGRMEMQVKNQMGGSIRSDGQAQWCSWKNGDTQVNNQMGRLNSAVGRVERRMVNFRTGSIVQSEEWREACLG